MTPFLLDANVLIALAWPQHVHHGAAHAWFAREGRRAWATCPLTQTAFVRVSSNRQIIRDAVSPREAVAALRRMTALPGHEFWPDTIELATADVFDSLALVGHRQVSDAYLIALAQARDGVVATFDRGLAELIANPAERRQRVRMLAA